MSYADPKLNLLLRKASDVMKALSVEIQDEETERESPIALPHGSLERASTEHLADHPDSAHPA